MLLWEYCHTVLYDVTTSFYYLLCLIRTAVSHIRADCEVRKVMFTHAAPINPFVPVPFGFKNMVPSIETHRRSD